MKLTEAQVDEMLADLRERLLKAEHIDWRIDAGVIERENWETKRLELRPSGGLTLTIQINGGATVTRESPMNDMIRAIREEQG